MLGAALIVQALATLPLPAVPQGALGASYAAKIDKAEARVDFHRPAVEVEALPPKANRLDPATGRPPTPAGAATPRSRTG